MRSLFICASPRAIATGFIVRARAGWALLHFWFQNDRYTKPAGLAFGPCSSRSYGYGRAGRIQTGDLRVPSAALWIRLSYCPPVWRSFVHAGFIWEARAPVKPYCSGCCNLPLWGWPPCRTRSLSSSAVCMIWGLAIMICVAADSRAFEMVLVMISRWICAGA